MSSIKEPHYYSTDLANRTVTSRRRYEQLYRNLKPQHQAAGEASTWYLYSREAVPAIERVNPGARYIVMTRDPVEMVRSLHHHNVKVLQEDVTDIETAWRLQEERALGHCLPPGCRESSFLQYRAACSLGTLLARLYRMVPAQRVLHIPLDQLRLDPRASYLRVLDFLGVPDDGRLVFPVENKASGYRSAAFQRLLRIGGWVRLSIGVNRGFGLGRINERVFPKAPLTEEFEVYLEAVFAEERERLAQIISTFN